MKQLGDSGREMACHAGGRGFEPRCSRHDFKWLRRGIISLRVCRAGARVDPSSVPSANPIPLTATWIGFVSISELCASNWCGPVYPWLRRLERKRRRRCDRDHECISYLAVHSTHGLPPVDGQPIRHSDARSHLSTKSRATNAGGPAAQSRGDGDCRRSLPKTTP